MNLKIAQVGEAILKTPAIKVTEFDASLISFIEDLTACMDEAGGIGIAAPQVFDPRAIMIVAAKPNDRYPDSPEMDLMALINPEIIELGGEKIKDWEGCLSVPGVRGLVTRQSIVKVSYQDIEGKPQNIEWTGFLARVFLHEYDHLIGKTWLDRVESVSDIVAEGVYMKIISEQYESQI